MCTKKFPAKLECLYDMLNFVQNYVQQKGFNQDVVNKVILATEEALVNVIKYGYVGQQGEIEVSCEDTSPREGLKILIKDRGIPFNPVQNAQAIRHGPPPSTEREQPGGFGVYIYVGIMDGVEYQRVDGGNNLSLTKYK